MVRKTTRITVALLFVAWTIDYVDRQVINLALPSIGETFGLSHGERGLIISAFFAAYALFQIPGGILSDRFGGVRIACLAVMLWSGFTGLTAAAWSFGALLAVRCFFGAAQGMFPGAALNTLGARSAPAERNTANGWVQSSNAVGTLLAGLLASALLSSWDWRAMFAAVSVLGLVALVAIRRWMPPPLPEVQTGAVRKARGATSTLLRSPVMWGFALMFFAYDVVVWGLNSWSASYLVERFRVPISQAGLAAIGPTVAAAVCAIVGGRLSDRFRGRPRRIIVPAMTAVAALLFLLPRLPSATLFVVCGTALSAAAGLCYIPCFSVPLRSLPANLNGVAAGLILFGGQLSGIITPAVVGYVVDRYSYTAALTMLIVGPVLAILAVLCVPQTTKSFLARFSTVTRLPEHTDGHADAPRP